MFPTNRSFLAVCEQINDGAGVSGLLWINSPFYKKSLLGGSRQSNFISNNGLNPSLRPNDCDEELREAAILHQTQLAVVKSHTDVS